MLFVESNKFAIRTPKVQKISVIAAPLRIFSCIPRWQKAPETGAFVSIVMFLPSCVRICGGDCKVLIVTLL